MVVRRLTKLRGERRNSLVFSTDRVKSKEDGAATECKGCVKRKNPEKNRRPRASPPQAKIECNSSRTRTRSHQWGGGGDRYTDYGTIESTTSAADCCELSQGRLRVSEEIWVALNIEVLRADEGEVISVWSRAGVNGRGKWEIPKKTRRPAALSGKTVAPGARRTFTAGVYGRGVKKTAQLDMQSGFRSQQDRIAPKREDLHRVV
ncbi:hypothetical protein PR048_027635 [Dryococelus australis]|uniref:Uncharacterized protein n=1 Tax=Dryococelus australis TaxID=614101 RepID=A0ABQ9GH29_9NEOP|nr:hypothetical protein PR048_027635 [Dryococelus australis]